MSSPVATGDFLTRAISAEGAPQQREERCAAEDSDEAVMRRLQAGDKEALGLLFDRYSRLILSLGLRILKDTSEAQELIQDVFLYVYQKSTIFDPSKGTLRSWLVQVVYSRAFDKLGYLKGRHFYDHHNVDDMTESLASTLSMEDYGESLKMQELVKRAFEDLSHRQRLTLQMFFFGGYSIKEISTYLDESLGNTRNHYYRGLEKIREPLQKLMSPTRSNRT